MKRVNNSDYDLFPVFLKGISILTHYTIGSFDLLSNHRVMRCKLDPVFRFDYIKTVSYAHS